MQVEHLFAQYGSLASVVVKGGEKESYAFVNFHSKSCAERAARELRGMNVGGRQISTKLQDTPHPLSLPMSMFHNVFENSCQPVHERNQSVKVTYLSKQTTEESLKHYFSVKGKYQVISVKIMHCDKPHNYAYVNYSSKIEAESAMAELHQTRFEGTTIKVKCVGGPNLSQSPVMVGGQSTAAFNRSSTAERGRGEGRGERSARQRDGEILVVMGDTPTIAPLASSLVGNEANFVPTQTYQPKRISPAHTSLISAASPPKIGRSHSVTPYPYKPPAIVNPPVVRHASQPLPISSPSHFLESRSATVKVSIYGELSAEDIEGVFGQFGKFREKIVIRPGTPSFCYVNYELSQDASKACALSNTTVLGVRVEVKLSQKQRNSSSSGQESRVVSCSSLIASILQANRKKELEDLEKEYGVASKVFSDSIKMWGKSDQVATAEPSLQLLVSALEEDISTEDCDLPCHSVPLFEQDLMVKKLHTIEEANGVEFRVLYANCSQEPINVDSFKEELTKCFSSNGSGSGVTESIPQHSDLTHFMKQKLQPATSTDYLWLWKKDNGSYEPYSPEVCSCLNQKFNFPLQSSFQLDLDTGFTYAFDFCKMMQTNQSTDRQRKIKKVPKESVSTQWYYCNDKKQYLPYTVDQSAALEHMYQAKSAAPSLTINNNVYLFDFTGTTMIQKNAKTKQRRNIMREVIHDSVHEYVLIVQVSGLASSLYPSIEQLRSTVSSAIVEKECHLHTSCSTEFKKRLLQNLNKYLVTLSLDQQCLKLKGTAQYVEKVTLLAEREKNLEYERQLQESKEIGGITYDMPQNWDPQSENFQVSKVEPFSVEWNKALEPFSKTLSRARVTKLQRIQNKWLWERYCFAKKRMHKANNGSLNEKNLFHGTRDTPPEKVIRSEKGIDFRYSSKGGLWGEGSYFAINASYSDNYSHSVQFSSKKQMLICKVLTGECYNYEHQHNRSLKQPPVKPSTGKYALEERYDSVKGFTNGSNIFVVYDHEKVYPAYLITYEDVFQ